MAVLIIFLALSTNTVMARRFAISASASRQMIGLRAGGQDDNDDSSQYKPKPAKWLDICSQIAPVTSVLCSLAPLPTILDISRSKSVGSLPLLPYSSMAANGFIWALYGILVDSPQVKWANFMGALLGSYYFKEFRKYSPPGSSTLPGTMNQHIIVFLWIILLNTFIATKLPKQTAAEIVGKEGVFM